jgi:MYXO-CTERM domain-containing protein
LPLSSPLSSPLLAPLLALSVGAAHAAEPPTFDTDRGVVEAPFTLTLSAEDGATIWVSLDGGAPDTAYTAPLDIDHSAIVRAASEASDGSISETATYTYLLLDEVMAQPVLDASITQDPELGPRMADSLLALPTVSLVVGSSLSETEQPVSFEYVEPGGLSVQEDCGVARVGGHSVTNYPKTNLRLYFRSAYGAGRLHADFFEDSDPTGVPPIDEHDSLDLRGGAHDSVFYLGARGQYLRNMWMDETELEMGHLAPHGRFTHLFVNGEYTGLYHLRERFDAAFLAEHRGGSEDDYAAVNGGRTVDGSAAPWSAIAAAQSDFATFSTWVDVDQYLDYIVLSLFGANTWDWRDNQNWMAAGPNDAQRAWVFHSSDSDISLYYTPDTWMLNQPGPAYTLSGLLAEAHPDFMVALSDALHRNLRGEGPLTAARAGGRYRRLAGTAEDAVIAEAARWGGGAWDPAYHWTTERDYLLDSWFPARTNELLGHAEGAGWLPLPAPLLSPAAGIVEPGTDLQVTVPDGVSATLWVRTDGGDPRLPGGAVADEAVRGDPDYSDTLWRGRHVKARLESGGVWGPIEGGLWEVDADPPIILNEWNTVAADKVLDDDGEDAAFGVIEGNGGDWLELLVLEDGLDLRGAHLDMADLAGDRGEIVFTDAEVLTDLRAGTLLTIAADLPEDASLDPDGGDWRFHVRATADGEIARTDGFEITHKGWQLRIWSADDQLLFGPVGEGRSPVAGVSSREVGLLAATPTRELRPDSADYTAGVLSTYGAPNVWEDGVQDLSALRGEGGDTGSTGDDGGDDGGQGDGGDDGASSPAGTQPETEPSGCGCATTQSDASGPWLLVLGLIGVAARRRRQGWFAAIVAGGALAGCQPTTAAKDTGAGTGTQDDTSEDTDTSADTSDDCVPSPETCNGEDDDCDGLVDDEDPDLVDGLPFYEDGDGDGFGATEALVTACALRDGLALSTGDCDDADDSVFPGAPELCDDIDQDCDGEASDALGQSATCGADTCLAILDADAGAADGAYWLALPSGTAAEIWCDMAGGGWTLGFLRNSAAVGNQGDVGEGEVGLEGLGESPATASASSLGALGWHDLNTFAYDELVVAAYASGAESYRSDAIPRAQLRIDWGQDGYRLYGGDSPYVWCGGDAAYTDAGVGAVNNPAGAPPDCRGHQSLGSGWDFSTSTGANAGLTLCGSDGSNFLAAAWGGTWTTYGTVGGAQAIWVR